MNAASYGLQAGVQSFSYAMFLMTDEAVAYLDKSHGGEIGGGPSVVIVDAGTLHSRSCHPTRPSSRHAQGCNQIELFSGTALAP